MSLLLTDVDVRRAVDPQLLVDGIESALKAEAAGGVALPPRMNLELSDTWLRVMPAIVPSAGVMGLKMFYGVPHNGNARYLVVLVDVVDGSVLAAMDARFLTAARTAATTAVASKYLSPTGTVRLGVIGSGLEAEAHCEALCATAEISEIKVFSPNSERRQAFAARMQISLGLPVTACDRPEDALDGADHVVVATNTGPEQSIACRVEWLRPGQHVSAIGSTNTKLRELDIQIFDRADLVVFDSDPKQMAEESGDVIEYCANGGSLGEVKTLPSLVGGSASGRQSRDELTLFKSVGTALQDVVAALVVYRRATELGLGTDIYELTSEKLLARSHEATPI